MLIYSVNSLNSHFMRIVPRSEIETRLSDAGLEMTPQRYAVLEYLMRSEEHSTIDRILENLKRLYPRPSRESIQKTVLALRDAGIICEEVGEGEIISYNVIFDPLNSWSSRELEED